MIPKVVKIFLRQKGTKRMEYPKETLTVHGEIYLSGSGGATEKPVIITHIISIRNEFQVPKKSIFTYQKKNQVARFFPSSQALVLFKELSHIFILAQFLNLQAFSNEKN